MIEFEPTDTVDDLKQRVHEVVGYHPDWQVLYYEDISRGFIRGFKLQDGKTLADHGVHENGIVRILQRYNYRAGSMDINGG